MFVIVGSTIAFGSLACWSPIVAGVAGGVSLAGLGVLMAATGRA